MNNILLELRARPFPHRMCMAEILKQGSVASVPSKWDKAVLRKPMILKEAGKFTSASVTLHIPGASRPRSPGKSCVPGGRVRGGLLPLRTRALPTSRASFTGSWTRKWSARSLFLTMMD